MALWFDLHINDDVIGDLYVRRREPLDLGDPATAEAVSTYDIRANDVPVGSVRHRYGDGAWALVALAADLAAQYAAQHDWPMTPRRSLPSSPP